MYKTCAFSGHRNLINNSLDYALLDRVVLNLVKMGTTDFLCGMALGFDMAAAETVINLKKDYDLTLKACLPCLEQSSLYSQKNKERYQFILSKCDEIVTISEQYRRGCMHERDRYMVDNCDALICFLRRQSGGTFYTVNYAKKKGVHIIEL